MDKKILFIHRRDLRLIDNTALNRAKETGAEILPCFIFTPSQIDEPDYRSSNAIQFMVASLKELAEEYAERGGRLQFFHGDVDTLLPKIISEAGITDIYFNADYTPFAKKRDALIEKIAQDQGVSVHVEHDATLTVPGQVCTNEGTPYEVFTPFYKKAQEIPVREPETAHDAHWYTHELSCAYTGDIADFVPQSNPDILLVGGRTEGLGLIRGIADIESYKDNRDYPGQKNTSHLSAHHKFGTVSIRESYAGAKEYMASPAAFLSELYWRDFYTHLAYFYPRVFGEPFKEEYADVSWDKDTEKFECWCTGNTGIPVVDAGMRELVKTGYMHNRVRMITASFLTKDLHLPWQWGEKFFAEHLTDYDPAVNNGSWQWAASTGADGAPYFRIFNPWRQQERFDPECTYIKQWVSELKDVPAKAILQGQEKKISDGYREPMVDHRKEAEEAKRRFKVA